MQALLGPTFHGVFPGHAVVDVLDRHFLLHDFTPAALRKGLQASQYPSPQGSVLGHCYCEELRQCHSWSMLSGEC